MPIRPELRRFYGAEWRSYRELLISIHGPVCTRCHRVIDKYLNFAHTTHDPKQMALVSGMCPSCHGRFDAPHAFAMRRRLQAKRVGQLWLFEEVEWEPYASWMIPKRIVLRRQKKLFD
jgi:hypothetical protein